MDETISKESEKGMEMDAHEEFIRTICKNRIYNNLCPIYEVYVPECEFRIKVPFHFSHCGLHCPECTQTTCPNCGSSMINVEEPEKEGE